ncbi:hypothetical protein [Aliikangiella coralliicola]|uniref:Twin-arginine translocation pathway signal protein n=1 Tax=Aliikangiella coralliicola TaxID=2592383 RepID=A0A545UHR7_9GAMM|nr:hypothetical protein [Aliikangiella coralliicola]TQV88953.1 hypothetical protein FLL46_05320 [Aliikangiella coralliicola]
MMKRRQFFKSLMGTSVLMLGGVSAFQWYQQSSIEYSNHVKTEFLTADDQVVLSVLIPIIAGDLPQAPNIETTILNVDEAILQLPLRTQAELRELFDLLSTGVSRLLLAGVWLNWQKAGSQHVIDFLDDWREHSLSLLQQAYIGLRLLVVGSIYAEPDHWAAIGYPGPYPINQ